jgi:hypothetical protein
MNIRSSKGLRMIFALALTTTFTALSVVGPAQLALADAGGEKGHTFNVTLTIWMSSQPANPPSYAGVSFLGIVGGAIGKGHFVGKILNDDTSQLPNYWLGHTRYEVYGEKHSFIADVHVTENLTTYKGVITGVVTQGWLKGAQLTGEFTEMPNSCPIATPGNAFPPDCMPGALHIHVGSK